MSSKSKKPSGAQYRKRRAKALADDEVSAKRMSCFLTRADSIKNFERSNEESNLSHVHLQLREKEQETVIDIVTDNNENADNIKSGFLTEELPGTSLEQNEFNDIGQWPTLTPYIRDKIIKKGPHMIAGPDSRFPIDNSKVEGLKSSRRRKFSLFHCTRILANGETFCRVWLQYSDSKDRVYCFCCKLFGNPRTQLGQDGLNNWKHIGKYLKMHETSSEHFVCYNKWRDAEIRLRENVGIDAQLQIQMKKESEYWKGVLERLFEITIFLSEHNLAFRGSTDKLYTKNNGNFLSLVELLAKYDFVLAEHIRRIQCKKIHDHYLGKTIQNELMQLIGNAIKTSITESAKTAKYFSVILDCTPDISHQEQLSFTVRFVDCSNTEVEVKEHFLTYRPVCDSTGEGLTNSLLKEIEKTCGLDMKNCRGQGYDNGANMVGKNKGLQARVLQMYPRAFFNPCGCHSLNLVVSDAASSSVKSVSLFGILQRLFVLFSSSTKRWKFLTDKDLNLTVKEVCETRWESRIDSLKSVRYQFVQICEALESIQDELDDPKVTSEAKSLESHLTSFDFIVTMIVWYDILFQTNLVSKNMQRANTDLPTVVALMRKCENFLKDYRTSGYVGAVIIAKEIAESLGIEPVFKQTRPRRKRRKADYEARDEAPTDPEIIFKTTVFYPLIDNALSSIQERFTQLDKHNEVWGFLYNMKKLPEHQILKYKSLAVQEILIDADTNESDIDGQQLCDELVHLQASIKDCDIETPLQTLTYISKHSMVDCFPNVWICLRVLLTIPVSAASGERSFSKLKLIKTYLRSTISQERLNALAIISIENDIVKRLDFSSIMQTFAESKARRGKFM